MSDSTKTYTLGDVISQSLEEPLEQDNPDSLVPVEGPGDTTSLYRKMLDDEYPTISLNHDQAKKVGKFISNLRAGGPAGIPLVCQGPECPFNQACPLYATKLSKVMIIRDERGQEKKTQATLAPLGQSCPLEASYVMDTRDKLIGSLYNEIDANDIIKKSYINELSSIAMMEWRCQMKLASEHPDVTQSVPGAVTPDGRVLWKMEVSPIIDLLERLSTRKSRLLNELVATPKEKYKKEHAVGKTGDDSLSRVQAAKKAELTSRIGKSLPPTLNPNPGRLHTTNDEEDDGKDK